MEDIECGAIYSWWITIISPIIKTDDIYIIGHSKEAFLRYCIARKYDTKIKKSMYGKSVWFHRS
jgi:hypothetical protein